MADRGAGRRPAAHPRRRGLPARDRRRGWPAADREVWNTYGPTEATVVACAARLDRRAAGADRAAAGRLGPGRRRRGGAAGRRGRERRADHRRGRPGPLPRPGEGRREVRADADPRLGARLPQRRPGPERRRGPGVPRAAPTTRSSSAAAGSSSARSTARCWRCPASPARRPRCARTAVRQPDPRRLRRGTRPGFDPAVAGATGSARPCRRRWCRGSRRSTTLPTRTSGKIDRDALPWPLADAWARRAPRALELAGTAGWLQELWLEILGRGRHRRGRRLLRPRRRQPRRCPARVAAARAVPEVTVADVYEHPTTRAASPVRWTRWPRPRPGRTGTVRPVPRSTQLGQAAAHRSAAHPHRAAVAGLDRGRQQPRGVAARCSTGCRPCRGGGSALGWLLLVSPPGRMVLAAAGARLLLRGRRRRASTRAAAASTCGSGSPSGWPTSSVPPTSPAHRWMKLVRPRARRARSGVTSTCTRSRRSPAC